MANPNPFRTSTNTLTNKLNALTISAQPSSGTAGQNRLDALEDVRMTDKSDGAILVYDADLKKFVLQTDVVSGGTF